ncbi:MAG: threonine synthase [Proteobacteria bacterium]|nr:threonine synthase [Pseudomonadota bacterium]
MRYVSTRGAAEPLRFDEVLLTGLARDGGLYVPETWPRFSHDDIRALAGLPYADVALRVMTPFVEGAIEADALAGIIERAYARFDHPAVAPLREIGPNEWLMELFHGPTLSFKDYAMQILGGLFDHVLARRAERVTIVVATSGDTGSAAIEACRDRAAIEIFVLHPQGRVSEVQRRQMTTVAAANVHNIAIEGTFDDCQALVKGMFNDHGFRADMRLTGVNSINWARILGQTVYYFAAAATLGAPEKEIAFSVPTGNFGNIYAGYAARAMGLPIGHLVLATNCNDILSRFLETGALKRGEVETTLAPSMDIQVASNFERFLFDLYGRDGSRLAQQMAAFQETGEITLDDERLAAAREVFDGFSLDDAGTVATIGAVYEQTGELLDPHTAIGVAGAHAHRRDPAVPMVSLATAHPAKFPEAVALATGQRPALPEALADLFERDERLETLANDLGAVEEYVRARAEEAKVA